MHNTLHLPVATATTPQHLWYGQLMGSSPRRCEQLCPSLLCPIRNGAVRGGGRPCVCCACTVLVACLPTPLPPCKPTPRPTAATARHRPLPPPPISMQYRPPSARTFNGAGGGGRTCVWERACESRFCVHSGCARHRPTPPPPPPPPPPRPVQYRPPPSAYTFDGVVGGGANLRLGAFL